jgi:alpha-glucosidase
MTKLDDLKWWQKAVFYQIYPRSFADGNGDGIGDLRGITDKLSYLQDLGIEAIWLSPHYPSPLYDCGYDIADYTDVAPEYGLLGDFQRFLDAAHRRGMRVILDLVLNHTSHKHDWFIESRTSRDNPKRDWYIWRDGRDGGPPNNWNSTFGGSAWEYDPRTGQYYYHFFFKEQPDLNWRNPEVKAAVFNDVRFWLDMGIDGFRLDAIDTIYEHPEMPDHEAELSQEELFRRSIGERWDEANKKLAEQWEAMFEYQVRRPGIHALFKELRALIDEYDDRMLVGETSDVKFYGDGSDELHMAFNFPLMRTPRLTPEWVRANQEARLSMLPPRAWPCNTLGNHDAPRVYSRYGDGEHDDALARISLALMLTLRGTPFLYNGEEIGMTDYHFTDIDRFQDLWGLWHYEMRREIFDASPEEAARHAAKSGRDKCRTPMQWADAPNGGFCPPDVTPWLPVNPNYVEGVNVAAQENDPDALLNFYRALIQMRQRTPALIAGDYAPLLEGNADVLAFLRRSEAQTCLVVLNFSEQAHTLAFELRADADSAQTIFSNRERADATPLTAFEIAPFEIYIGEIEA